MITANGPPGSGIVLHFPDGTDQETVINALRQATGSPLPKADALGPTQPSPPLPGTGFARAPGGPLPPAGGKGTGADSPPGSSSILPLSWDQGGFRFDPGAGILGAVGRAFTLPGEVYQGKVDPLSKEGVDRAIEMGAVLGPANPAVRSGESWLPGPRRAEYRPPVKTPSADELRAAGGAGFDAAREMGVDYVPDAVAQVAKAVRAKLEKDGIFSEDAPKTFRTIDKLSDAPIAGIDETVTVPFTSLEAARRAAARGKRDFTNPTEQEAARHLAGAIDEFVSKPNPADVVVGPFADVATTVRNARGNYAAAKRSDQLYGIEESADLRTASRNSGRNYDNTLRQKVADILLDPKKRAGYTAEERDLLEQVVRGTATQNRLRDVGNILGGGGGLGATAAFGTGLYGATQIRGPGGLAVAVGSSLPVIGWGAKAVADAMGRRAFTRADEAVRQRSPLYKEREVNTPMVPYSAEKRAAIVRALMLLKQQQQIDQQPRD